MHNRYGLSRDIPEAVKRAVRQNCDFGCIFCGLWIYQYEHIDPEFKDAREHNPNNICLLCPTHHQKVTSGRLTKQQVKDFYSHPKALERGYANDYLSLNRKFYVTLGRIFYTATGKLLEINGQTLFELNEPTDTEPMKLNCKIFDDEQNLILEVKKNEFIGLSKNWDIEQSGSRTIFRKKSRKICLQINLIPPDVLEIEIINLMFEKNKLLTNSSTGEIFISASSGGILHFPEGQIITEGLSMTDSGFSFNKALIIGVQSGLKLSKLDYRAFIDRGEVRS